MLHSYNPETLTKYRLEQARKSLESAERELKLNPVSSVNRFYYCIFHAMRAVLALDLFDTNKHSGIISAFRQKYIKTKIFEASFSDIIGNAFRIRNRSDYEDFYIVSKHEAAEQLENAGKFLHAAETYLSKFLT